VADDKEHGGSFTLGFILGGIIGALAAMLMAPKAGAETRSDLAERSQTWRSRADEMAASMRERVGPSVESAVVGVRGRFGPAVNPVIAQTPDTQPGTEMNGQNAGLDGATSEEQV